MSHTCSATLVRCMDFRLESAIERFLKDNKLTNDVDIVSGAGAAKDISQQEECYIEKQVDLSCQLHDTKTVLLMNHTDCGGYGGREAFGGDRESERQQHIADMRNAKDKLTNKHPGLEIKLLLADIKDGGKVEIEEIE